MMHSFRWIVASGLTLGFLYACGGTTENSGDTDTSDSSTGGPTSSANGNTTTSTVTGGVTSSGSSGPTTGTGGTTSGGCPSFEPSPGSGCAMEGDVCVYDNCEAPDFRDDHQLTCLMGAWTLTGTRLCEVDACPAGGPALGGYCDATNTPGPCAMVDACGMARELSCINGTWQPADGQDSDAPQGSGGAGGVPLPDTTGGAEPPLCPVSPPYWGTPCCPDYFPAVCDYRPSATDGAAGASFIIIPSDPIDPTGSSTGSGTSGGGAIAPLDCAVCADTMTWEPCEP